MSTKQRYHIHICLVRNEDVELQNSLQYALSIDYFLTWDLLESHPNFAEYSRQQIDQCDYLLFVLGNDYGHLSPSGVSYLHLNYIYAATKRVPMVALIKNQSGNYAYSRQRLELSQLIRRDQVEKAIYFNRLQEGLNNCLQALTQLTTAKPRPGWLRNQITSNQSSEIVNKPYSPRLTALADKSSSEIKSATITSSVSSLPSTADTNYSTTESVDIRAIQVDPVALAEPILVNYSAHAYEGGNLTDILAAHTFTWGEIITILNELSQPFSSDMMLRKLNESLKNSAVAEANRVSSNIHAVSRCQINAIDYQWLKAQLINKQWIVSAKDSHSVRELWRVNVIT